MIFLFTSNLYSNLDAAFLSRCFIKEFVDVPATDCVYEILRSELNGLIQLNKVSAEALMQHREQPTEPNSQEHDADDTAAEEVDLVTADAPEVCLIPDVHWAKAHSSSRSTAVSELYRIAGLATGLAGRNLRGLLTLARFRHTVDEPCELRELLHIMELVICKETGRSPEQESAATASRTEECMDAEMVNIEEFLARLEAGSSMSGSSG